MKRKLFIILVLAALIAGLWCASAMAVVTTGPLGENVSYENDGSGTIRITGTGATNDYGSSYNLSPLDGNSMTAVEIGAGVTYIGNNVLINCENLTSVTINNPDAVISSTAIRFSNANITIHGWEGSTAAAYADANGYTFQSLGSLTGNCGANVTYSFDPATGEMTISGTGAMADYNSDDTPWYTYRNRITSLSIGNGVTHIGKYAFYGCDSMTDVIIPVSVTSIGYYSFCACSGLTDIMIPDNVTSIDSFAFYSCDSLTSITIPAKVTNIASYAFYSCDSLTNVTINNPATNIGTNAFKYCSPSLTIYGWTGSTAETYANDNSIPFVSIGSTGSCGANVTYSFDPATGELTISGTGAMADYNSDDTPWYTYRNRITSLSIGNGVTHIGKYAFYGCDSMTDVIIPVSVTSIGYYSFCACSGLTDIMIPDNVTSIDSFAFYSCDSLTSITIPAKVTNIASYAFYSCDSLTNVTINNPATNIGTNAFKYCSPSLTIYGWPDSTAQTYAQENGITFDAMATTGSCGSDLTWSFDPAAGALSISGTGAMTEYINGLDFPWYSFHDSIKSLTIGPGVTTIHRNAFYGCTGLTSVTIPFSVTKIGYYAFGYCTNLTSAIIMNSACVIGDSDYDVFEGCASGFTLRGWEGSTAQTYAGNTKNPCAFVSLGSLTGSCGSNVTYYFDPATGKLTISGTGGIRDFMTSLAPWYNYRSSILSVTIESGVTRIGHSAFLNCAEVTSLTIPDSVTDIGPLTFRNCFGLTSLTIPSSVTSIGYVAFSNCAGLTSLTIPSSVTSIGHLAFEHCAGLTSATIWNPDCVIGDSDYDVFKGCDAAFTLYGWPGSTAEVYAANTVRPCGFEPLAPAPDFILPSALTSVELDAFVGISAHAVVIPRNIQSITGNPFAGSSVEYIYGFPGTAAEDLVNQYHSQFQFIPMTDAWYDRLTK